MTHRSYDDESPAYLEYLEWLDDRDTKDLPWMSFEDFLKNHAKTEPAPAPDFESDTDDGDISF